MTKSTKLTGRKKEIITLLAAGYTVPRIAEKLIISRHTVKSHITEMFNKFGVNNQCELVAWGFRNGFLM